MDFSELSKARYSVRRFKSDQVSDEDIAKILAAAKVAPTACNNQPQRIIAVKSEEGLRRIKKCTLCHFDAPLVFIIGYDKRLCWYREDGRNSGDVDAAIVTSHMMLEAADIGLGSTWVMLFDEKEIRKEFLPDENIVPVALLPVGHPAEGVKPAHLHSEFRDEREIVSFE